ncbi:hypothetical protein BK022_04340 [Methylorubrum extorquens]|uniref:Uncharacterized protein n=1 Tax=Methylorubrum extorquens TaxID=408 RepID=A0A1S1PAK2_METEX|nr:hypothetical protein BK022_04340 [Methylorubrum extorquens]
MALAASRDKRSWSSAVILMRGFAAARETFVNFLDPIWVVVVLRCTRAWIVLDFWRTQEIVFVFC